MASKAKSTYICSACGASSLRWCGQCPTCGEFVCFDEEILEEGSIKCPDCGELLEFSLEDDEDEEKLPF